jgi:hypothetical protein
MFPFSKVQAWLSLASVLVALFAVGVPVASAQQPIALSGYNAQVITPADPENGPRQSFDGGAYGWYESGATDDHGRLRDDDGLVVGAFVSAAANTVTGGNTVFQIQPTSANNVLLVGPTDVLTLSLATPASYSTIAILASSGSGGGFGTLTINYDDGSTDTEAYMADDWCDNYSHSYAAVSGLGRGRDNKGDGTGFLYRHECDFGMYETDLVTDPTKNLVSVTFTQSAGTAAFTGIFGISGQ